MHQINSPVGPLLIAATNKGICMVEFLNGEKRITNHQKDFHKQGYLIDDKESNEHIEMLKKQLEEYFNQNRKEFDLPIDMIGSDFQISVWKELLNIPYGSTRSYKQQALALNNLKGIRAVANANGQNKISIVVPCHRVIGSDGSLTGFGGGLSKKKFLLDLESEQTSLF